MNIARANAHAACALVEALAAQVRHAIISPGSRNTPLVLALDAAESIETHVILDERTAAFFALGLSRATATPVILNCTSGSAGAHYLPAVIEAYEGMSPLIILTADRPPELHGHAAAQTTDQSDLFARHVVLQQDLPLPDEVAPQQFSAFGAKALSAATQSPGPVHLNAPFREPLWTENTRYWVNPPATTMKAARAGSDQTSNLDPGSLDVICEAFSSTRRGLIVAGPRMRQDQITFDSAWSHLCHRLADAVHWPLFTDATSGLRHAESEADTHVTGFDALLRFERFRNYKPERVLILGRPPTSKTLARWLADVPAIVLSHRPDRRDPELKFVRGVAASPFHLLSEVIDSVNTATTQSESSKWSHHWHSGELSFRSELMGLKTDGTFWEGAIAHVVAQTMPAGSALHVASSRPIRDLDGFCGSLLKPITVTANRGINGIDGTIATAAGQATAWISGPTALLVGDLAFLHDLGSVRQVAASGTNLTIILINNGAGRIFDRLPISQHPTAFDRYFAIPHHTQFSGLIEGLGARHVAVTSLGTLREALLGALPKPGLDVIESVVEPGNNSHGLARFMAGLEARLS